MWSKLFGGGDVLPREKVDAVVHVIDRYLAEEAELRRLQSEKQTIHPRDLPPTKRRALIEEVFAILGRLRRGSLPPTWLTQGSKACSGRAGTGNS